jgi:bifunctional DNase/RNase
VKVIEAKVNGLILEPKTQQNIVVLRETDGERILPIWIGPGEAQAIRRILAEEPFPRPLTHDLLVLVVEGLKAKVTRVVISICARTRSTRRCSSSANPTCCRSMRVRPTRSRSRCARARRSS